VSDTSCELRRCHADQVSRSRGAHFFRDRPLPAALALAAALLAPPACRSADPQPAGARPELAGLERTVIEVAGAG